MRDLNCYARQGTTCSLKVGYAAICHVRAWASPYLVMSTWTLSVMDRRPSSGIATAHASHFLRVKAISRWCENGDVTVAVFSEVQSLNTSARDLSVCMSVRMSCVCGSSSNDGRPSCPIHVEDIWTQAPLTEVFRDYDAAWSLPSEHVVLVVWQWCRCVLVAWMQWPWMEAVCVDVSQNLAPLDTCHVMFLDVATTMLSKLMFFLSVFILPHTFFLWICALALPV